MVEFPGLKWMVLVVLLGAVTTIWQVEAGALEQEKVRIKLASGLEEIRLAVNEGTQLVDMADPSRPLCSWQGDQALITGKPGMIFINGLPFGKGPLLVIAEAGYLTWNDRVYRGSLLLVNQDGIFNVINILPLEEYLRGVIPKEIPAGWPMAALKAQAIAARTYTLANLNRHRDEQADLCANTHCQVYEGMTGEQPNTDEAISQTAGMVLTYKGKLISAVYHDSSGGYTKDASEIWGHSVPYLKPVPDWDFNSPYSQWLRNFSWPELQELLSRAYPQLGAVKQILPVAFGNDGRIIKLTLKGDCVEVTISGEQFRYAVGIPSSNMKLGVVYGPEPLITMWWLCGRNYPEAILTDDGLPGIAEVIDSPWDLPEPWSQLQDKEPYRLMIRGSGRGHGVGLSQWGAKGMAEAGYNERQILEHFYSGAVLTTIIPGRKIVGAMRFDVSK